MTAVRSGLCCMVCRIKSENSWILCSRSEQRFWSRCLEGLKAATFHSLLFWKWAIIKTKHRIIPGNIIPFLFHLQESKGVLSKNREQDRVIKWEFTAEIFFLKLCLQHSLESAVLTINNTMNLFIYHRMQFKLSSPCTNCHQPYNSPCLQGDDLPPETSKILLRFNKARTAGTGLQFKNIKHPCSRQSTTQRQQKLNLRFQKKYFSRGKVGPSDELVTSKSFLKGQFASLLQSI